MGEIKGVSGVKEVVDLQVWQLAQGEYVASVRVKSQEQVADMIRTILKDYSIDRSTIDVGDQVMTHRKEEDAISLKEIKDQGIEIKKQVNKG